MRGVSVVYFSLRNILDKQGEKAAKNYGNMTYPSKTKGSGSTSEPVYDNMPHV